jgi:hypothetical protein
MVFAAAFVLCCDSATITDISVERQTVIADAFFQRVFHTVASNEVECVPCSRGACGRCLPRSSFTHRPSSGCTACMIGAGEVEDGQTMVVDDAQRLPGTA